MDSWYSSVLKVSKETDELIEIILLCGVTLSNLVENNWSLGTT
jgi:hypothetical protein